MSSSQNIPGYNPTIDLEKFYKPNNPVSLDPLRKLQPSNNQNEVSGGTAHILPNERKKATFDVETLTNVLDGGPKNSARRRWIISTTEGHNCDDKFYWNRNTKLAEHIRLFMEVHDEFLGKFIPTREDGAFMSDNSMITGSFINHFGLFLPTLLGQASGEQQSWWIPRAFNCSMVGVYAQTELGHGSNVRGLRTTATYKRETKTFELHTPSLQAVKWWVSGIGKVATHAAVYAQLIIDDKEYGIHIFMVQLRDENHRPLPGIEIGDVGPKLGDDANDTGFLRLNHVHIPREHMFAKWQEVTEDGEYVKSERKTNSKVHYATMVFARGGMIKAAGGWLARAVTIATRYSIVRSQGFVQTKNTPSYKSPERAVLDYQMQNYRVMKQLSLCYAIKFSGNWMLQRFKELNSDLDDTSALPEIAATAAGLKGLCSFLAANGMEDLRKCCGGHGFLLSSGIAAHFVNYVWQTTAEGDYIVMMLQSARFLIKNLKSVRAGKEPIGPTAYLKQCKNPNFNPLTASPALASDVSEYYNPRYILEWYKYRSLVAVLTADKKFNGFISQGLDFDTAWNKSAISLVNAAIAHSLTFMFEIFLEQCESIEDEACKEVILKVAAVYGLTNMIDSNWEGLINNEQIQLLNQACCDLLDDLRPNAVSLVDAFDIPDRVLQSCLGRHDGNVYEALFEAALKSQLNQQDPFVGYEKFLEGRMDKAYLLSKNKIPDSKL